MSRNQAAFKENDIALDTAPCSLDTAPCAEEILTHFIRILTKSAENLLGEHGGVLTWTRPRVWRLSYGVLLLLRISLISGGSLLVGTTPKCLRYLNCPRLRRERKRLSVRVIPIFILGGQVQPFPGLSLKKVYAESLRSMYAPNEVDGESFTAQSAQGRLSSKSSLGMKVFLGATRLSECGPNISSWSSSWGGSIKSFLSSFDQFRISSSS
ncbi:hypothetical protein HanIR_Chr13g0627101 [Helianthus annuus]|nr:hypothetical protein HanIR_Chr13g0627101 [Helianthus annuus]